MQLDVSTNDELVHVLKSNPSLLKEVLPSGEIVDRFKPMGLLPIRRIDGPCNGRVQPPAESRKRFDICTEACYCTRVPMAAQRSAKVRKVTPEPEQESESDSD